MAPESIGRLAVVVTVQAGLIGQVSGAAVGLRGFFARQVSDPVFHCTLENEVFNSQKSQIL